MTRAIRVGHGFDTHRFSDDPDRPLILGGVRFEGVPGLVGHSDGDAVAHAVADALLSAASLGDIGVLFPDTDDKWAGADSLQLLADAVARLADAGWKVVNADCTVVAEAPRIAPRRDEMEDRLSSVVGAPVTVKGKRAEALGALGSGRRPGLLVCGADRAPMSSRNTRGGRGANRARGRQGSDPRRRGSGPGGDRSEGRQDSPAGRSRRPKGLGGDQVEGRQAVRELLLAGTRPTHEIVIAVGQNHSGVLTQVLELAAELRVPVKEVPKGKFESMAATEAPQGVLARAASLPEHDLDDLARPSDGRPPFLLVLDGITDPGNVGAALRTAECAGSPARCWGGIGLPTSPPPRPRQPPGRWSTSLWPWCRASPTRWPACPNWECGR